MKSTVSLTIYDEQDEIIQSFSTSRIRWGIIEDVVDLSEKLEGKVREGSNPSDGPVYSTGLSKTNQRASKTSGCL
jgi:hypothetical protein